MNLKKTYESFNKQGFEEWAENQGLDISPYSFDKDFIGVYSYQDIETEIFWRCWKAGFVSLAKLVVDKKEAL